MAIINQNGLLYDTERHVFCGYEPIPISDAPGLSCKRKVVQIDFRREWDFELTIQMTIDYFNEDGSHFLTEALAVETFDRKRQQLQEQFRPFVISRSTRGSWVDPARGFNTRTEANEPVTPENTANAIPELAWFQGLNASALTQMGIDVTGMTYEQIDYAVTIALVMTLDQRGQL